MRAMLSERCSLLSTNWPDLILLTSFCGNGSDAGERIRPVAWGDCELLNVHVVELLGIGQDGATWFPSRSATEVSRYAGKCISKMKRYMGGHVCV